MKLRQNINAFIRPGEQKGYVAECLEISIVTQGETLDEVANNLVEAVTLHLEDEEPAEEEKERSRAYIKGKSQLC